MRQKMPFRHETKSSRPLRAWGSGSGEPRGTPPFLPLPCRSLRFLLIRRVRSADGEEGPFAVLLSPSLRSHFSPAPAAAALPPG
jgi:hypothetical protein